MIPLCWKTELKYSTSKKEGDRHLKSKNDDLHKIYDEFYSGGSSDFIVINIIILDLKKCFRQYS